MKVLWSIFLFVTIFLSNAFSQNVSDFSPFNLALNFYVGFPQGEFKQNINRNGYGLNVEGLWKPYKYSPFSLGADFGILNYGSVSRREPFSYTIPDVFVKVTNDNNILNYHLIAQVAPAVGIFKPYVQFLFGGSYIYTQTRIENRSTGEEIATSTNFDDNAWSYGAAGGFMFRVSKREKNVLETPSFSEIFLNLKVSYLFGSNAEYLKEGSIRYVGAGKVEYDIKESKTDLIGLHIGVVVIF